MSGTILYVDDDTANLVVFQAACADQFATLTAQSGREALEIIRGREIAVLLVDQRMPEMSGVELLEAARHEFPDTVRILVTAYSDLADAISAINRGQVRHYVRKPWDLDHLRALLSDSVEVYETRRKLRELEQRLLETERVYALGVIVAGVAHEIRGPLGRLMMTLDIARLKLQGVLNALESGQQHTATALEQAIEVSEQIASAKQAVGQISAITTGIELSTRRTDDQASADLGKVVELTLSCVRSELLNRAQVRVEIEAARCVQGSPTKWGQVVMNLLLNALQALPERARSENLVSIQLRSDKERARLEVEDNGSGIPGDVLPHIFDPFFTTKSTGGTGLGLAISRKIVEEFRGTISVESEAGKGTRFTVTVPLAGNA